MWLWVVSVLLLLLVWAGSFSLSLLGVDVPMWVRVCATLAVVLMVVGVLVYRRVRAGARARALEREIIKQSQAQAATAKPDRRAEILELQRQIEHGIDALKRTKVGKTHGARALYVLPWYAIIGPPGAGKTTALRHSGLVFPFLDATSGGGLKGVGGTRNCDWWFTNEAIILDTAGRYATQDDDNEEWLGFLGLLRKFRPAKPLNGLLVAISVQDLMEGSEEQIAIYAQKLRSRIDEIMTRLDMVLPVYVVFTKVDLVAGFVEFWEDLRKSERDQIFGATFPVEFADTTDPRAAFAREFETLSSTLHARALRTIRSQRHPEARQKVFQFPLEFRALKNDLEQFVGLLFQRNTYQENPVFRGFYLTSGTQEGTPIDRVLGGMARAFGLRRPQAALGQAQSKSYFVTDLFRRVIFPDQDLAGRTSSELRRQRLVRIAIAATAVLFALILGVPALVSFAKNQALIQSSTDTAKASFAVNWKDQSPALAKVQKLAPAETQLKQLDAWDADGPPIAMRWGMYAGDTLFPAFRDAFLATVDTGIVQPAKGQIERKLRGLVAMGTLPPALFAEYYNQLKLYIMLSGLEHLDVEWAAPRLTANFADAVHASEPALSQATLPLVKYYLEFIQRKAILPWSTTPSLIAQTRGVLLQAPQLDRMYEVLVRDANAEIPAIRMQTIFYGSIAPFVTAKQGLQVDGAYTQAGWSRIRVLLGAQQSKLADESWVLGESTGRAKDGVDKQIAKLRELYFSRFNAAWTKFLNDMVMQKPENASSALDELNALSEPEWPYLRLLRTLHENVALDVTEEDTAASVAADLAERAKEKIKSRLTDAGAPPPAQRLASPVELAFKPLSDFAGQGSTDAKSDKAAPTGLAQYQALIAKLVGVLTDLRDSQAVQDPKAIANQFEDAFRTTSALLAGQDGFTRPLLSPYLMRPITGAWSGVVNDSGGAASGLWEVSVWDKWRSSLEPFYPFSNSSKDAKLEDFTAFFKPKTGQLWGFLSENLQGSLEKRGANFQATRRFQSTTNFANEFLSNCLKRGDEITNAVFPGQTDAPNVEFDVNLHSVSPDVSEVRLEIDGVVHVYKNTPEEWLKARWPAQAPESRGARVHVRGSSGLDEEIIRVGDFGFFRLLDAANEITAGTAGGRPDGAQTLVATWKLRSPGAFLKLDVRPTHSDVKISSALFRNYKCPRVIATVSPK
jgi:type VI secretion system protein ImpL